MTIYYNRVQRGSIINFKQLEMESKTKKWLIRVSVVLLLILSYIAGYMYHKEMVCECQIVQERPGQVEI